jgi:HAD superfamily hydrolase (TIGR01490 family)
MGPRMNTSFSIYDMDKTITRAATFGPFLLYAVPRLALWRIIFLPFVIIVTLGYALKIINRARLKEINLSLMLGTRIDAQRLANVSSGFAQETLVKNCLAEALDRIAADRAEGRTLVLATASYAFYVVEIAKRLGIDHVVATQATAAGSAIQPKINGENCYGAAKRTMVQHWLCEQGLDRGQTHIRFYSDHVSDTPCLEWADEAYATNPHGPLRAVAKARGWTVFDWK